MIKWLKARSRQEKVMIVIIIMSAIGIALRWNWIKQEVGEAVKTRVERSTEPNTPQLDTLRNNDDAPAPDTEGSLDMSVGTAAWQETESTDISF